MMGYFSQPAAVPLKDLGRRGFKPGTFHYACYYAMHLHIFVHLQWSIIDVDDLFRKFLTQGGADFWSQLGDFLNDSQLLHARLSDIRPVNQELDDFEDDE
jgi:hypothetical protein